MFRSLLPPLAVLVLASTSQAQKWIPLTTSGPPGTPAQIQVLADASNAEKTVFELKISGFWREDVVGPDGGAYQKITVPGLPDLDQEGKPLLPAVRSRIAVLTDAKVMDVAKVTVVKEVKLAGYLPWPEPIAELDEDIDPTGDPGPGDPDGTPATFVKDPAVYGGTTLFPPDPIMKQSPVTRLFDAIPGAAVETYPMQWDPQTKVLTVQTHVRYELSHAGVAQPTPKLTKGLSDLAKQLHMNAAVIDPLWLVNLVDYHARYLILVPEGWESALKEFVLLKKKTGYQVTVETYSGGLGWLHVLARMIPWYGGGEPGVAHYCMLIGDVNRIAQPSVNGAPTDDWYGSPLDLDAQEEVFVGRLSVDDLADLESQLKRIVQYQVNPAPGPYQRAILAAHLEGAPGKYQGCQESVRTATYWLQQPTFVTVYGLFSQNLDLTQALANGAGLLCYRGHGSTNTFSGWNVFGQSFHKNDVVTLAPPPIPPVVWSISCTNNNLLGGGGGTTDSIGEVWMEEGRAVATYGATVTTSTKPNHELDRRLFEGLYGLGLKTHAHAIFWGEMMMEILYPQTRNHWAYLLLGDPSMRVRTTAVQPITMIGPTSLEVCAGCPTNLAYSVKSAAGHAVAGEMLISFWKEGPDGTDEVFLNRYADSKGHVDVTLGPLTPGKLHVTAYHDSGDYAESTIEVTVACGTKAMDVAYGTGKPGILGVPELVGVTPPVLGKKTVMEIRQARPGALPILVLGLTKTALPFDGGTLLASPDVLVTVPVPVLADGTLQIPGAAPDEPLLCGFPLHLQALIPDKAAGGVHQIAMTNGLTRVFGSL